MTVADRFTQDSLEFFEWLRQQPGVTINPKINIADFRTRGAGRGIIALETIDQDEELFSIPHTSVVSIYNSDLGRYIHDDLAEMDPWLSLVLVMIYESGQGRASRWWPYLTILPSQFDTLVYWSAAELEELEGSAIRRKIGKDEADAMFISILLPLVTAHADLFGEYAALIKSPDAKGFFLPLAHHMATLVMAYAFDLEKRNNEEEADEEGFVSDDEETRPKGLVLLADMLNADGDKNNARLFHNHTCLTMTALERVETGEEIFNTYGELPRADLLRRYGYINDSYKKWDVVEIDANKILEIIEAHTELNEPQIINRTALLREWDVWEDSFDLTRQSGSRVDLYDGFDPALLTVLKVFTINEAAIERFKAAKKPLNPSIDLATLVLLQEVTKLRQGDYIKSIAEDVKLLHDNNVPGRSRMAIEVRLGEKEILASTLEYVNQKTRDMLTQSNLGEGTKHTSVSNSPRVKRRKV